MSFDPNIVIFTIFGAVVASFIGVIAERAYTGQSWKRGRSKCNSCREQLGFLDLIPVVSWLAWTGKCRHCRIKLPFQYVVGEVVLGILFALSYITLGLTLSLGVFLIALCILYFVVIYDLRHTVVPTDASNMLIAASIAFSILQSPTPHVFFIHLLVAGVIASLFFLLYYCSRGRAMGFGDTPVSFALSLLVGSAAVPGVLFSFWIGAFVGLGILLVRRGGPRMGIEVPFVPFMAVGFLLAFFTLWNPLPFLL